MTVHWNAKVPRFWRQDLRARSLYGPIEGASCKVVLIKETVIKAVCKGTGVTLMPSSTGDVGIVLSLGTTDCYCAQFGGDIVKTDVTIEKRKDAPAPATCP